MNNFNEFVTISVDECVIHLKEVEEFHAYSNT